VYAVILLTGHQQRVNTDTAYVNVLTRGDLSSLHWIESPLKYFDQADHPDQQLCRVHYTALNFRDVMLATGKLPPDAIPGIVSRYLYDVYRIKCCQLSCSISIQCRNRFIVMCCKYWLSSPRAGSGAVSK